MLNYTEFFMLWKGFTEKRIGYWFNDDKM